MRRLGIVLDMPVHCHDGQVWVHIASGRVIDELATRWDMVLVCAPCSNDPPRRDTDHRVAAGNVEIVRQPHWTRSLEALAHPIGILQAYARVCRGSDAVFIRGMCPFTLLLYAAAAP